MGNKPRVIVPGIGAEEPAGPVPKNTRKRLAEKLENQQAQQAAQIAEGSKEAKENASKGLDRQQAAEIVKKYTKKTEDGFSYVTDSDVVLIIGIDKFSDLTKDPIRKFGPIAGTVYPWNVIDYLVKTNEQPTQTVATTPKHSTNEAVLQKLTDRCLLRLKELRDNPSVTEDDRKHREAYYEGMIDGLSESRNKMSREVIRVLNQAFRKDMNAIHTLIVNSVACNEQLADDEYIVVKKVGPLEGDFYQVTPIGLMNGVLSALGLPLVAVKFSEPDSNGSSKILGFTEYTSPTQKNT